MKNITTLLITITTFLHGCKGRQGIKALLSPSPVLHCGITKDLIMLDLGKCDDPASITILSQCFEGLMQLNEKGSPIPNLAEKIETSKDGKIYTFHIKKGVKFHNGDELTAQDFKWTFERNLNKKFNSTTAFSFLGDIEGAKEYQEEKISEIKGIRAIDLHTLQIKLTQPRAYFLDKLSSSLATCVLNSKTTPKTEITQITDLIGTGPFKFKERTKNSYTKLVAHTEYHNKKPHLDAIEYLVIEDFSMMLNKVKKGDIELADVSMTQIQNIQKDPLLKQNLHSCVTNGVFSLEFNPLQTPLFQNPKFRLAIAHAIDQNEIVREAVDGNAIPVHYLIPQGLIGSRSDAGKITFDLHQSKKLLQEAQIDPKKTALFLTTFSSLSAKKVAENISVQLRKNLGMKLQIHTIPWGIYNAKVSKKEVPFCFTGWLLNYPDPSNIFTTLYSSTSSRNHCGFSNKNFDKLAEEADATIHPTRRAELYQKAEDILLEEAAIIPLFIPKRNWLMNPKVKNVRYNSMGYLPHNYVTLE